MLGAGPWTHDVCGPAHHLRLRSRAMFTRLFALFALSLAVLTASGVGTARAATDHDFVMTADFRGLYPNADLVVPVSVYNPQPYDLAVLAAAVVVGDAGPECPASNVIAHTFSGDIVVPSHHTAVVPVRVQMLVSAPDDCQGAMFPLTFDARAEIVSGTNTPAGGFAFTGAGAGLVSLFLIGFVAAGAGLTIVLRRRSLSGTAA